MGNIRKAALLPFLAIATALTLTACGGGEKIDEIKATANCGITGRMLNGDLPMTAENIGEIESVLTELAKDSVGPVKDIAARGSPGRDGQR